jgi:hypothetical protein
VAHSVVLFIEIQSIYNTPAQLRKRCFLGNTHCKHAPLVGNYYIPHLLNIQPETKMSSNQRLVPNWYVWHGTCDNSKTLSHCRNGNAGETSDEVMASAL